MDAGGNQQSDLRRDSSGSSLSSGGAWSSSEEDSSANFAAVKTSLMPAFSKVADSPRRRIPLELLSRAARQVSPNEPTPPDKNCPCGGEGAFAHLCCDLCKDCLCDSPPSKAHFCGFLLCNPCLFSGSLLSQGNACFCPNKECTYPKPGLCFRTVEVPTFLSAGNKHPTEPCDFCGGKAIQQGRWCKRCVCRRCLVQKTGDEPKEECIACNRHGCFDQLDVFPHHHKKWHGAKPKPCGFRMCPETENSFGFTWKCLPPDPQDILLRKQCPCCKESCHPFDLVPGRCGTMLCKTCVVDNGDANVLGDDDDNDKAHDQQPRDDDNGSDKETTEEGPEESSTTKLTSQVTKERPHLGCCGCQVRLTMANYPNQSFTCQHSICLKCLKTKTTSPTLDGHFDCPLCRQPKAFHPTLSNPNLMAIAAIGMIKDYEEELRELRRNGGATVPSPEEESQEDVGRSSNDDHHASDVDEVHDEEADDDNDDDADEDYDDAAEEDAEDDDEADEANEAEEDQVEDDPDHDDADDDDAEADDPEPNKTSDNEDSDGLSDDYPEEESTEESEEESKGHPKSPAHEEDPKVLNNLVRNSDSDSTNKILQDNLKHLIVHCKVYWDHSLSNLDSSVASKAPTFKCLLVCPFCKGTLPGSQKKLDRENAHMDFGPCMVRLPIVDARSDVKEVSLRQKLRYFGMRDENGYKKFKRHARECLKLTPFAKFAFPQPEHWDIAEKKHSAEMEECLPPFLRKLVGKEKTSLMDKPPNMFRKRKRLPGDL